MDEMALAGMRFNNGYATSATCTPSRYALLTGLYPWREKRAKILAGTAPLIIGTDQMTLPKMLKQEGYQTAIIGKWHLGLGNGNVNWNQLVSPGPNEVGFDYSYILAAIHHDRCQGAGHLFFIVLFLLLYFFFHRTFSFNVLFLLMC